MTEKTAGTKIWFPFYRGMRLIWVSVLRGSTVIIITVVVTLITYGGDNDDNDEMSENIGTFCQGNPE